MESFEKRSGFGRSVKQWLPGFIAVGTLHFAQAETTGAGCRSDRKQVLLVTVGANQVEQNVVLRENCPHVRVPFPRLQIVTLRYGFAQGKN